MQDRRQHQAFTLIELLVVIGIIAILSSMILVAIKGVYSTARDARCVANMKQWATFIHEHSSANRGALPPITGGQEPLYAAGPGLREYFAEHDLPPSIAYCPSNPALVGHIESETWGGIEWQQYRMNFDSPVVLVDNTNNTEPSYGTVPTIIVDDGDSGFSTTAGWTSQSYSNAYNQDYHWIVAEPAGEEKATWQVTIDDRGGELTGEVDLLVCAFWPNRPQYTLLDAHYTIEHEGDPNTSDVVVSQYNQGDEFIELGTFTFNCGSSYTIELTNESNSVGHDQDTNKYIYADAIRLTDPASEGSEALLPDDGSAVMHPGWQVWSTSSAYGGNTLWINRDAENAHKKAVWVFTAPSTGEHKIYGWWPESDKGSSNIPVAVRTHADRGLIASDTISQSTGGRWIPIITAPLTGGVKYYVELSSGNAVSGEASAYADAICIPKVGVQPCSVDTCIGYLYLGDRVLPELPVGAKPPEEPPHLVRSVRRARSNAPILVDWMADTDFFCSHDGFAHVLTIGGVVHKVQRQDASHRWTSPDGVMFYW
ncbi:MAG: prepilin-type N-terminal cleavage/methylation domain-containing protein [Planctomycetota bacterium]